MKYVAITAGNARQYCDKKKSDCTCITLFGAKRTNWFDNDIAKSNLRIFIEVICDDMWDEARNQCECSEQFNKDFAINDAASKLQ